MFTSTYEYARHGAAMSYVVLMHLLSQGCYEMGTYYYHPTLQIAGKKLRPGEAK